MYIQARIRKYVIGGADLPPPTLNRVNFSFFEPQTFLEAIVSTLKHIL